MFVEASTDLIYKNALSFFKIIYFIQILHEKQSNFQSFSRHKIIQNVHQAALIHHPHPSVSSIQLQHPRLPVTTPEPARFLPNLPSRQIPLSFLIVPHKTNPLLHFLCSPKNLSLQTHFAEKISSCIDSLQGVKTASQLVFFVSKLFHFLNQTGHHNQIHRSREDKEDQSRQQMQVGETDLLLLPKYSLKVFVPHQGRIGNLHLNRER